MSYEKVHMRQNIGFINIVVSAPIVCYAPRTRFWSPRIKYFAIQEPPTPNLKFGEKKEGVKAQTWHPNEQSLWQELSNMHQEAQPPKWSKVKNSFKVDVLCLGF